jgi:hypothetical protein
LARKSLLLSDFFTGRATLSIPKSLGKLPVFQTSFSAHWTLIKPDFPFKLRVQLNGLFFDMPGGDPTRCPS